MFASLGVHRSRGGVCPPHHCILRRVKHGEARRRMAATRGLSSVGGFVPGEDISSTRGRPLTECSVRLDHAWMGAARVAALN